jgi:hypothetical protein
LPHLLLLLAFHFVRLLLLPTVVWLLLLPIGPADWGRVAISGAALVVAVAKYFGQWHPQNYRRKEQKAEWRNDLLALQFGWEMAMFTDWSKRN